MITDYASLQDTLNIWLSRQELPDRVETFIQIFETEALLDNRIRETKVAPISIDSFEEDLPADFKSVVSWSLDGADYRLPLIATSPTANVRTDDTDGIPRSFLVIASYGSSDATDIAKARFSPPPDGTYASTLIYRAAIEPLSNTNTTNWLLRRYPAIYLYGALMAAAPYLKDDQRIPVWMSMKEEMVMRLNDFESRREFSGPTDVRHTLGGAEL